MGLMSLIIDPTIENLGRAAEALKNGALVGLPTETVYGLAADAENNMAVRRLYEVKERPNDHPVIIHIGYINYLEIWAKDIPDYVRNIVEEFWPGPLTIILDRSKIAKDFVTGNQNSVALRMPRNKIALDVIRNFHKIGGNGLAAPSANKFGRVSCTDPFSLDSELGPFMDQKMDLIINGGFPEIGIESTILDCRSKQPSILRFGSISEKLIYEKIGIRTTRSIKHIKFPGDRKLHYAPIANVHLNKEPIINSALIALKSVPTPDGVDRISEPIDLMELTSNLYRYLREADRRGHTDIFIKIAESNDHLYEAIIDRLTRAQRNN